MVQRICSTAQQKTDQKKLQEIKKVFVEAYFENIRDGMNQKEALQKAKSIALCFLLIIQ